MSKFAFASSAYVNILKMPAANYRETELWQNAKKLLIEAYRLTKDWPEDGQDVGKEIRQLVRQLVKAVPSAHKRGGITGNVHLRFTQGQFGELEALCEAAEVLGFVAPGHFQPLLKASVPVQDEFRSLAKAAQARANELRKNAFGSGFIDDDDGE